MSSSNVQEVTYYPEEQKLKVKYCGGSEHMYHPITNAQLSSLLCASSLSEAVHRLIRIGQVVGVKL